MSTARQVIIAIWHEHEGDWLDIFETISSKKPFNEESLDWACDHEGEYITIVDEDYPSEFKTAFMPPFVINR